MLFCWFCFSFRCNPGYKVCYPVVKYFLKEGILTSTPAAGSLAAIISDIGSIVTGAVSWVGSFVGAITDNPLILMFVIVGFVGLGVGLIKRLIRL